MNDSLENKVILTIATTGAVTTREHTPYVPLTPKEIADEVYECYKAGAAIAHIHVRDDQGKPTMDIHKFREVVTLIRERCDIVLNITSSGGVGFADDERILPIVELKPELGTLDAGTINWRHETIFENHPKFLEKLGKSMKDAGVKPEIEVFDSGMLYNALHLNKHNFINSPMHFQFVLGAPGGTAATVENLVHLKNLLPERATWGAFGIGKMSVPIMLTTIALGGHVRVGMEDNIFIEKGILAKNNIEFINQAKTIIEASGKEIATPDEARAILGLN